MVRGSGDPRDIEDRYGEPAGKSPSVVRGSGDPRDHVADEFASRIRASFSGSGIV